MAEHQLTCAVCSAQFTSQQSRAVYCGPECKAEASRQRRRRDLKPRKRIMSLTYECWWCGKEYHPKRTESNKACSRECGFKVKDFLRAARATRLIVSVSVSRRRCDVCSRPYTQRNGALRCSDECRSMVWRRYYSRVDIATCRECGTEFSRSEGGASRWTCSERCKDNLMLKARRSSRASRKALERGAMRGDKIDPISVFERDAWRCAVCGRKTHKSKRGTYHDRAPELDHIIALANGGTHTWGNVQCACRACNGAKGATDYGQLTLFPTP